MITLDELIIRGKATPTPPTPPKPSDIAIIMYTSGTTGLPKGVKISHENVVATVAGLEHKIPSILPGGGIDKEVYLAYMPLAHIMEMAGELMGPTRGSTHTIHHPCCLTMPGHSHLMAGVSRPSPVPSLAPSHPWPRPVLPTAAVLTRVPASLFDWDHGWLRLPSHVRDAAPQRRTAFTPCGECGERPRPSMDFRP